MYQAITRSNSFTFPGIIGVTPTDYLSMAKTKACLFVKNVSLTLYKQKVTNKVLYHNITPRQLHVIITYEAHVVKQRDFMVVVSNTYVAYMFYAACLLLNALM